MKVLIVDDEVIVARALQRAFQKKGHDVFVANNAMEGLRIWELEMPGIVLLDVVMPHMTGPQLLQEIKSIGKSQLLKSAKIVFMSAHSLIKSRATAEEMGGHAFIQKPFENVFELVDKVTGSEDSI